jgi:hypothetical protein
MSDKLSRAMRQVKQGDRAGAQQLLGEILANEPDNELAWLWLAAVLSEDQGQYCIRQVLRINPNSQPARRAWVAMGLDLLELQKTYPQEGAVSTGVAAVDVPSELDNYRTNESVKSTNEVAETVAETDTAVGENAPETVLSSWLYPAGGSINLIAVDDERLLSASIPSNVRKEVVEQLDEDCFPEDLLKNIKQVPLRNINEVTQYQSRVQIRYLEDRKSRSFKLSCADERMSVTILNALGRKLGPRFERRTEPVSLNAKIVATFLLFMFLAVLTAALFFGAIEISTGSISLPIDVDGRLFGAIGPLGVLAVGGLLMLITFISMIIQYNKPPKKTVLALDESL